MHGHCGYHGLLLSGRTNVPWKVIGNKITYPENSLKTHKKIKLNKSENFYRAIGAIVIIVGLYLVVWGKSKDYESSSAITEENVLSAKQTVEKSNSKEEHFSNLGTIARDEQV